MHSPYPPLFSTAPAPAPAPLPELLLVEPDDQALRSAAPLRDKFHVTAAATTDAALRALERVTPAIVITELALPEGSGTLVCRAAKQLAIPATVLVTTASVEQVPEAIEAGCDAVLLKPFAPNLLFARVGRLQRARSIELRYRAVHHRAKLRSARAQSDLLLLGTNQQWPKMPCPHCGHQGITSFEFTSYRRAWYACLDCRKVWLAKRPQ